MRDKSESYIIRCRLGRWSQYALIIQVFFSSPSSLIFFRRSNKAV